MIYYVYRSLSKQKTGKGKISFATFQHFNIFASGSGPFFNYYMVPFLIIIYIHPSFFHKKVVFSVNIALI